VGNNTTNHDCKKLFQREGDPPPGNAGVGNNTTNHDCKKLFQREGDPPSCTAGGRATTQPTTIVRNYFKEKETLPPAPQEGGQTTQPTQPTVSL